MPDIKIIRPEPIEPDSRTRRGSTKMTPPIIPFSMPTMTTKGLSSDI